jgi:alpha-methylacyl-CoA racemase
MYRMTSNAAGPLAGVRIVELQAIGPVPYCGMLLADMGAGILLVEPPQARDAKMPVPVDKDPLWRGRSRLALDLKVSADIERLLSILEKADILLEGFRPGVMERLGLGPDVCLKRNPKLVYGRMTGWGQTGPLSKTAGHDPNYTSLVGVIHSLGYPDRPPTPPLNLVGDFAGGSLFLAMGVLAALTHARAGGAGQVVDAAIVDGAASLMTMVYSMRANGLWSDERGANMMDGSCPFGCAYETADGRYMMTCCIEPPFYAEMLKGLGLDPASLPKQYDRSRWPELHERFAAVFRTRTRDAWAKVFEHTDACVTPVLDMGEAMQHPQNAVRGVFVDGLPAAAPRFNSTPTAHAPKAPPAADLLRAWGADFA